MKDGEGGIWGYTEGEMWALDKKGTPVILDLRGLLPFSWGPPQ